MDGGGGEGGDVGGGGGQGGGGGECGAGDGGDEGGMDGGGGEGGGVGTPLLSFCYLRTFCSKQAGYSKIVAGSHPPSPRQIKSISTARAMFSWHEIGSPILRIDSNSEPERKTREVLR